MTYEFLTPEWIEAVRALREAHPDAGSALPLTIRMNLRVTEVPWGQEVTAHVDTPPGPLMVEEHHLEGPDLSVTVDYATAKALLVDGNPQAALSSFMAGKIQVDGDMTKLLALQGAAPDERALAFALAIRELTT